MTIDGGLRKLFQQNLPEAHWQAIESGGAGLGIPDMHYCFPGGVSGWIEMKQTKANAVIIRPEQVAWAQRYARVGGRIWFAVRQKDMAGKRKEAMDNLWLFRGQYAGKVKELGLETLSWIGDFEDDAAYWYWTGGPAKWKWDEIKAVLS